MECVSIFGCSKSNGPGSACTCTCTCVWPCIFASGSARFAVNSGGAPLLLLPLHPHTKLIQWPRPPVRLRRSRGHACAHDMATTNRFRFLLFCFYLKRWWSGQAAAIQVLSLSSPRRFNRRSLCTCMYSESICVSAGFASLLAGISTSGTGACSFLASMDSNALYYCTRFSILKMEAFRGDHSV
jgi:hypothetical protein